MRVDEGVVVEAVGGGGGGGDGGRGWGGGREKSTYRAPFIRCRPCGENKQDTAQI